MGRDKAFLELGGKTLLARGLTLAASVAQQVMIVGDIRRFSAFGRVVPDVYPERGPLGGIHAALTTTTTELNLILAVDLPFLTAEFLRYLVSQARQSQSIVTVPCSDTGFQPLCAAYRKKFRELAEQSLLAGQNKIDSLFAKVSVRILREPELSEQGFEPDIFRNLNTREEWENAQRLSLGT